MPRVNRMVKPGFQTAGGMVIICIECIKTVLTTGTLPNIRNTLNKKSTSHSGPRIAANSVE